MNDVYVKNIIVRHLGAKILEEVVYLIILSISLFKDLHYLSLIMMYAQ